MQAVSTLSAHEVHVPSQNSFAIRTRVLPSCFALPMLLDHMPIHFTCSFYLRSLILVLPPEHLSYVRYGSSHIAVPFWWLVHL